MSMHPFPLYSLIDKLFISFVFFYGFGKKLPEGRPHTVSDTTLYCIGAAGILRYKRELDHRINLATILPAVLTSLTYKFHPAVI